MYRKLTFTLLNTPVPGSLCMRPSFMFRLNSSKNGRPVLEALYWRPRSTNVRLTDNFAMAVTYSTCSPRFSTAGGFFIYAIIHLYLGLSPLSKVKHLIHYPGLGKVFFLNFRESFYFTFNSIPCLISFHIAFHFSFVKINHCVTSTCVRETF